MEDEISIFLEGFYSLAPSDQEFLRGLLKDYRSGTITDQEFSNRLQDRKSCGNNHMEISKN